MKQTQSSLRRRENQSQKGVSEHFVDFLSYVDGQIPPEKERIYAILDNLEMHHCQDLLLLLIHHPRWEFVYQPKYAAYLNLIELWWKAIFSNSFSICYTVR